MKIIKATILTADTPNANGRTYARDTLERAVAEQEKKGRTWVTLGMPKGNQVDLAEIAGQAGNWSWDGDNLIAEIAIMDTPRGALVKELLAAGECDYRSAGYGEVDRDGKVTNFRFISIGVLQKGTGA
jgi:Prohead core protein serine protease